MLGVTRERESLQGRRLNEVINPMGHGCRAFLLLLIITVMLLPAQRGTAFPVDGAGTKERFTLSPPRLDFGIIKGREIRSRSVLIETRTDTPLDWSIKGGTAPWLTLSAESGTIGESPLQITATIDSLFLSPGRYETELLCVIGTGHVTVPLSFTLLEWQHGNKDPHLEQIRLHPAEVFLRQGERALLAADVIYSDGTEGDMTESVSWVSGNDSIVRFPFKGMLEGKAVGDTYILAEAGSVKSDVSIVRVDQAAGPLLRLSPSDIEVGRIEQGIKKKVSLTLRNRGKGPLKWSIRTPMPWILIPAGPAAQETAHLPETGGILTDEDAREGDAESGTVRPPAGSALAEGGRREITLTVDTTDLPAGEYEGKIFFHSNGGDDMVRIFMTVVSLEKISISPTLITLRVGETRSFRATGIWSDKRRSDLSPVSEGQWIVSDSDAGFFHRRKAVFTARKSGCVEIRKVRKGKSSNPAYVEITDSEALPVLMTTPREVALGKIGPGERSKAVYLMENVGAGSLEWSALHRDDASREPEMILSGTIGTSPRYVHVMVDSLLEDDGEEFPVRKSYPVLVRIASGTSTSSWIRELPPGIEREEVHITYNGGTRSIFFNYEISSLKTRPDLKVMPFGVDFGRMIPGEERTRKVMVRNDGTHILAWNTLLQKNRTTFRKVPLKKGRYLSFFNEDAAIGSAYAVPDHLKERVFFSGEWHERDGYPYSTGDGDTMRFTFEGKGVTLFLWKDNDSGTLNAFIDGTSVGELDCASFKRERVEFTVADDLVEGTHLLTVVGRKGIIELEGLRIEGADSGKSSRDWLRVFPNRGTTAHETDYVNVIVNTRDLAPGIYAENIIFYSENESEVVEVSVEVTGGTSEFVTIYKYVNDSSCLLTPRQDDERGDFKAEGAVFTLFPEGTPGTSPFYRWYRPSTADYYYAYELNNEGIDREDYLLEGAIGNIATVRLPGTRELYRWYNLDTGMHFYTTDIKGEGCGKRGYRYDGIAGYVK